jgi:anti-sigma factor RsiW
MQRLHPPRAAHARRAASWRKIRAALHSETSAFVTASTVLIAAPLVTLWLMLGRHGLPTVMHGWVTIALSTVGASAAAIGLLAPLLASDPCGHLGRIGEGRGDGP